MSEETNAPREPQAAMPQAANPPPDDPAHVARALLRGCDMATLGTLSAADGGPYVSLVQVASDHDGAPLLLVSDLAEHTRNARADSRVSLLFDGTAGLASRLTGARLSLVGRMAPSTEPRHRERFLARHPGAASYAGFADFSVFAMAPERAHLVAGFGRIHWLDWAALRGPAPPELVAAEAGIVAHMNADHGDAIDLYARVLAGRTGGGGWRMTGCDAEGIDLRRAGEVARIPFARSVTDAAGARAELVRLARLAREA